MNVDPAARRARRLLWTVVACIIVLNAIVVYFALHRRAHSAEENREVPAATDAFEPGRTNTH